MPLSRFGIVLTGAVAGALSLQQGLKNQFASPPLRRPGSLNTPLRGAPRSGVRLPPVHEVNPGGLGFYLSTSRPQQKSLATR